MRVDVTARDDTVAVEKPAGWRLVRQADGHFVFERIGATAKDLLVWIQLLERREAVRIEFTRISDGSANAHEADRA